MARGSPEATLSSRRSIRTAADKPSMPAVAGKVERVSKPSSLDFERILALVRPLSTSLDSVFHGEDHWRHVASIGLDLAERTPECDPIVVVLFAVLHDARRIGDDDDPQHGARGAALVRSLDLGRFGFSAAQLALVETACRGHTGGALSGEPTIGTCWDADRLTLWRVGIAPTIAYMSTAAGREAVASGRHVARATDWSEVARRLRRPSHSSRSRLGPGT